MQKVKYKDSYIYVDDSPLDEKETGIIVNATEDNDETMQIKTIKNESLLEDTNPDMYGDNDE